MVNHNNSGSSWAAQLPTYITALTAVAALIFTGLSLQATNNQVALTRQGQASDRFQKAVEQLASPSLDVRLGGIYSLEQLARDSDYNQPAIVQILGTFVRLHNPVRSEGGDPRNPYCPAITPADVEAAAAVLGRRDPLRDNGSRVDLSNACLAGAELDNAQLAGANLFNTYLELGSLEGANLQNANMEGAVLGPVILDRANLAGALLRGAKLSRTSAEGANFSGANLQYADLTDGSFEHADFSGADLTGVTQGRAHFDGADLSGVKR